MTEAQETTEEFESRIDAIAEGTYVDPTASPVTEPVVDATPVVTPVDVKATPPVTDVEADAPATEPVTEPEVVDTGVDPVTPPVTEEGSTDVKVTEDIIEDIQETTEAGADTSEENSLQGEVAALITKHGIESVADLEAMMLTLKRSTIQQNTDQSHVAKGKMLAKAGIQDSDIVTLLELKKGNTKVLEEVLKTSGMSDEAIAELGLKATDPDAPAVDLNEFTQSDIETSLDDLMVSAKTMDVSDGVVVSHILDKWDNDSVIKLLSEPASKAAIVRHLSDGTYDKVYEEVDNLRRLDYTQSLNGLSDYDLYTEAVTSLGKKEKAQMQADADAKKANAPATPAGKEVIPPKPAVDVVEQQDAARLAEALRATAAQEAGSPPEVKDSSQMGDEEFKAFIERIEQGH